MTFLIGFKFKRNTAHITYIFFLRCEHPPEKGSEKDEEDEQGDDGVYFHPIYTFKGTFNEFQHGLMLLIIGNLI